MNRKELAKDLLRVAVILAFCAYIVMLVGCAGSLGANPREWTEVKANRCAQQGGLPVYNENHERTMCSTDLIW